MIAVGFGFRREVATSEIITIFEQALRDARLDVSEIGCFAVLQDKAKVPALAALTHHFGIPARPVSKREMLRVKDLVVTRSARVEQLYGVGSVAEAVALFAVGDGARLILPRLMAATATCAIAGTAP